MNESNKIYWTDDDELVERYVLGQLSADEKKRLDEEIAECEPCKEKLQAEFEIAAGIRRYGRDMMKARLRKKLRRERAAQFYSYQYIGLAAAVVIIAIGIGLYQIWFSDLVAPKRFHDQQVVLTPQQDTVEHDVESHGGDDHAIEAERRTKQSETRLKREQTVSQLHGKEIAVGESIDRTTQSSSGAVSVPQQEQPPTAAIAEADALSDEVASSQNSSAIWLIGKVVMISKSVGAQYKTESTSEQAKKGDRIMAKEKASEGASEEKMIVSRLAKDERIILKQRAIKELPLKRIQQRVWQSRDVETLLERSDDGISLTLYIDSVHASDLKEAVVEAFTNDSLVVSFSNQRIAFSLPSGWNTPTFRKR
ncbi:MAG: hypothetical protein WDA22_00870 [Bacteroidota bacterium]